MQGLSRRQRFTYFWILVVLFLILTPLLALYAAGYRLNADWHLVQTGGLFIDTGVSGVTISLDTKKVFQTGIFDKAYFIKDLTPGTYTLRAEKSGFQVWVKKVSVYPQSVTRFMPFLLPDQPLLLPIEQFSVSLATTTATSSRKKYNAEYTAVSLLFSSSPATDRKSTATSTVIVDNHVAIMEDKTGIIAKWQGSDEKTPYFFCEYMTCVKSVRIPTPDDSVSYIDFFPGRNDGVLMTTSSGIYLVELDGRSGHAMQILLQKPGVTFRISDKGEIFVKDGNLLYRVEL